MPDPFLLYDESVPRWFIQTHAPGKVLDVAGAKPDDGTQLIQYEWNGGPQQRFYLTPLRDDQWIIAASHSGRVLDVAGNGGAGTNVIQWPWHGQANQRWTFVPTGDHWGLFVNASKGLVLDVADGRLDNGTRIVVADRNDTAGQAFKPFFKRDDGKDVFLDD